MGNSFIEQLQSTTLSHNEAQILKERLEELLTSKELISSWAKSYVNQFKGVLLKEAQKGNFLIENGKKRVDAQYSIGIPQPTAEAMKIANKMHSNQLLDFSFFDILYLGYCIGNKSLLANWGVTQTGKRVLIPVTHYGKKHFWSEPCNYIKKERVLEYGFGHFSSIYFKSLEEEAAKEGIIISTIHACESDSDGSWESSPITAHNLKTQGFGHYYCCVYFHAFY